MKSLAIAICLAAIGTAGAVAQSIVSYNDKGRIDRVVRSGPSGPIIYDGRGNIVAAIRGRSRESRVVIDIERNTVRSIGTGLTGGVGDF